jgi:predicted Rossmann fold flavoprotein
MKHISSSSNKTYDVIVIGGGPAGMMAAGKAAELGARVLLVEKNPAPGKKLLITGGGRSNITNDEKDDRKLLAKYGTKGKFLFSAFAQFDVEATLNFFHTHGMPTKLEAEGRVFPATEKAESVWQCLVAYMKAGRVTMRTNAEVTGFQLDKGVIAGVKLRGAETLSASTYILATGGTSRPETGSTGEGFHWLKKIGHTVKMPEPALVPIRTKEVWAHKLSGLSFKEAKVSTFARGIPQHARIGKILFTHVGLSGPLILNMSKDIGEQLKYGDTTLTIDIFPKLDNGALDRFIQEKFRIAQNKKLKNVFSDIVPSALAHILPDLLKLDPEKEVNKVSRTERMSIIKFLKSVPLTPTGLLGVEKAVVVSGGVDLKEVDFKTMRSRLHKNLCIIGDVLDIDRPSGGYSLQLCWTTGFVAGTHAATSVRRP